MEFCPNCGEILYQSFTYSCGSPVVHYTCKKCGFDSSNNYYWATSTTGDPTLPVFKPIDKISINTQPLNNGGTVL